MHKGGDGDANEEKVERAHHVRHVCRMSSIKYLVLIQLIQFERRKIEKTLNLKPIICQSGR